MLWVLRIIGWFGVSTAVANAAIKLFGDAETIQRYAGSSRDLDTNITIGAFSLIFLALGAILAELQST